jgi:hypothetical protein
MIAIDAARSKKFNRPIWADAARDIVRNAKPVAGIIDARVLRWAKPDFLGRIEMSARSTLRRPQKNLSLTPLVNALTCGSGLGGSSKTEFVQPQANDGTSI